MSRNFSKSPTTSSPEFKINSNGEDNQILDMSYSKINDSVFEDNDFIDQLNDETLLKRYKNDKSQNNNC